jgi:dihydrofolate reductase
MITLIAAMDEAGGIGYRGRIPAWHAPGDLAQFRRATLGRTVIMGRRTYEEIGRPLPGRRNIVVTSGKISGVEYTSSVDLAMKEVEGDACIIGGARLYEAALPLCTHALLTLIEGAYPADTSFPVAAFNALAWRRCGGWRRPGMACHLVARSARPDPENAFRLELPCVASTRR